MSWLAGISLLQAAPAHKEEQQAEKLPFPLPVSQRDILTELTEESANKLIVRKKKPAKRDRGQQVFLFSRLSNQGKNFRSLFRHSLISECRGFTPGFSIISNQQLFTKRTQLLLLPLTFFLQLLLSSPCKSRDRERKSNEMRCKYRLLHTEVKCRIESRLISHSESQGRRRRQRPTSESAFSGLVICKQSLVDRQSIEWQ